MQPSDAEILAALYDGITSDIELERALGMLADRFRCPSSALVSFDAAVPQADAMAGSGIFGQPDVQRAYRENFAHIDPAPRAFAALGSGTASTTNILIGSEDRRSGIFFNEMYRPIGLEECLGGNLSSRNGHFALIGIHRGPDRTPFDAAEVQALESFMPHLSRGLELRRVFVEADMKIQSLALTVDRLSMGVIVHDDRSREIHVNRAAREIAARGDGLSIDRVGLPHAADRAAERGLLAAYADVRSGGAGGIVSVPRKNQTRPYALVVAPLPTTGVLASAGSPRRSTLVFVHDPDARVATTPETIATIFGLPLGTARLVAALANGEDTRSYAERHGVTPNAIKFHLKTAFARTGFRNQARLLQAVARAIADLGERKR